jgi:hypothetical protein
MEVGAVISKHLVSLVVLLVVVAQLVPCCDSAAAASTTEVCVNKNSQGVCEAEGSPGPGQHKSQHSRSLWSSIMGGATSVRTDEELKSGIAQFYDETTNIWLDVWGDHLHHGYYETPNMANHRGAQELMIDRAIDWAYGAKDGNIAPKSFVDVGCGVGGSSRHIIRRLRSQNKPISKAVGLSLSPFQISLANNLTTVANMEDVVQFQVADALNMPYADGSFDLGMHALPCLHTMLEVHNHNKLLCIYTAWSMESGEQ